MPSLSEEYSHHSRGEAQSNEHDRVSDGRSGLGRRNDDGAGDLNGAHESESAVGDAKSGRSRRKRRAFLASGILCAHTTMNSTVGVAISLHPDGCSDGGDLLAERDVGNERDSLDGLGARGIHEGREGQLTSRRDGRRGRRRRSNGSDWRGRGSVVVARERDRELLRGGHTVGLSPSDRSGSREGSANSVVGARCADLSRGSSSSVTSGSSIDTIGVDRLAGSRVGEGSKEHGRSASLSELSRPVDGHRGCRRRVGRSRVERRGADGRLRNRGVRHRGDRHGHGDLRIVDRVADSRESSSGSVNAARLTPSGVRRVVVVSSPRTAIRACALAVRANESVSPATNIIGGAASLKVESLREEEAVGGLISGVERFTRSRAISRGRSDDFDDSVSIRVRRRRRHRARSRGRRRSHWD